MCIYILHKVNSTCEMGPIQFHEVSVFNVRLIISFISTHRRDHKVEDIAPIFIK